MNLEIKIVARTDRPTIKFKVVKQHRKLRLSYVKRITEYNEWGLYSVHHPEISVRHKYLFIRGESNLEDRKYSKEVIFESFAERDRVLEIMQKLVENVNKMEL